MKILCHRVLSRDGSPLGAVTTLQPRAESGVLCCAPPLRMGILMAWMERS